jgi:site-specific DNA recombinase
MENTRNMRKQLASIYARVSSIQQKNEETIDSQLDLLIEYADKSGFELPQEWIFKDEGYSGSSLDRPGLDNLRDLAREGALDVVLVYSPDRLSRRYVNQLILEEEFSKFGVRVIYLKGAKNETPEEQLLKHFQGIFAEYERTQILDRSRRGKLYKARQGNRAILPSAPFGYNSNRSEFYTVNNQKALIVKEIFHLYTKENYTLRSLAKYLETKGIYSPTGNPRWCPTSIRGILKNSSYTGTAYFGKTEKGEGEPNRIVRYQKVGKIVKAKNPKRTRPKEQWIPISVPAIITHDEFELAQELLRKNKERASRNTKEPTALQGLLVCGCCGRSYIKRTFYISNKKKRTLYYCDSQLNRRVKWCGNFSVRQEYLDELIWTEVIQLIDNPQLIENEIQRRIHEGSQKKETVNRKEEVEKEIRRLKMAQDKLLDAYQETECLDLKELKSRLHIIRAKEKEYRKELDFLNATSLLKEKQGSLQITINEFRRKLNSEAKVIDVTKKQKILRLLIEEIVINKGEITINHTIPLSFDRNFQLCSAGDVRSFRCG